MNKNKSIGNVTELKVQTAFTELGYNFSTPFGDCERYDFIADVKGLLLRIQCKTSISYDDGNSFDIDFRIKNHHTKQKMYTSEDIDYFATFFKDKCYLLPINECNSKKRLRLVPVKSDQRNYVHWAKDYELEKVINELLERQNDER